ncbi:MAG: EscU/YscU/HrcU family type III secretion system export apparatus switch protein [Polyangiaceae bacterium]
MSGGDQGEKQFEPTAQRREKFRREGRFPRAKDLGGVVATATAIAVLVAGHDAARTTMVQFFAHTLGDAGAVSRGDFDSPVREFVRALATFALPTALGAALLSSLAGLAQSRMKLAEDPFAFKLDRLDPISRLKELFSPRRASGEVAVALLRVVVVGVVVHRAVMLELPNLVSLASMSVDAGQRLFVELLVRVVVAALGATAILSAVEYATSWIRLEREMRMTRKELLDETKAQDGDPHVKQRMRSKARALLKKRSLRHVKESAVVVTNPTHVAVALRYSESDPAPVVVAKGHDDFALAIRREARRHGIPIVENRRLARSIDATVPIGHTVRPDHFTAVARVLAFVYRLRDRVASVRTG